MTNTSGIFLAIFVMILPVFSQDIRAPAYFYEFKNEDIVKGSYSYSYNTKHHTVHQSGGYNDDGNYVVDGLYIYMDPKTNRFYKVEYYADKNGYHPSISILPVSSGSSYAAGVGARQVASLLG